jgi:hypothetical protein
MRPSTDAIEMLLFEARPGRSLISPFVAMRPCVRVLAGDQRYDAIITPGGRVRIRRSGQSWPVAAGTRAPRGGHGVTASGLVVTLRLRISAGGGHVLTAQEAAYHPVVAPGMTSLVVIPPSYGGLWLRAATWTG